MKKAIGILIIIGVLTYIIGFYKQTYIVTMTVYWDNNPLDKKYTDTIDMTLYERYASEWWIEGQGEQIGNIYQTTTAKFDLYE